MDNDITKLANLLPYPIRDKLRYYLNYIQDRLIDIALEEDKYHIIRVIKEEVDFIFFVRLLYGYLVVGFQNYTQMLEFFGDKNVDGFKIGSKEYQQNSLFTGEWKQIANDLENLINEERIASFVKPSQSTDAILRQIINSQSQNQKQ